MIRVLLVDDQKLFSQSLEMTISNYTDDMEVIGLAEDGNEAILMTRELQPDVILMDVYMKKMNGVSATKIIHSEFPSIRILMLSTYGEDENVRQALLSGASGYLMKDISPTELIVSIRSLSSGVAQISPLILQKLIQQTYVEIGTASEKNQKLTELTKELTQREREIFSMIAIGYDNEAIASKLCLSSQTVRNYCSAIFDKLGVKDRFQIIRLANKL